MHTMFKGTISFGLVNIPIKMFTATEDKDIRFRSLHKKCHTPIKYQKTCPGCGEEIQQKDIVKGFEYEPGKFVIITSDDMDSAQTEIQARTIEIIDFISLNEVDPIYFDKTYYIAPQPEMTASSKAYNLLRTAMNQSKKIAVARVTLRDKQSLCVLRIFKESLVLETIFYPDEIRAISEIPSLPKKEKPLAKELEIAKHLIDNLTSKFQPSKYTNEYREALSKIIDAKIKGKDVVIKPEEPESNIIDLMEALKASVEKTEKKAKKKTAQKRSAK